MEFEPLVRRNEWDFRPEPGVFDRAPGSEWMPTAVTPAVVDLLRPHTRTPEACWFGFWCGYGRQLPEIIRNGPQFSVPARTYHLLTGTLDDAIGVADPFGWDDYFRAALWLPDDREWFLGSDTDLETTY